MKTNDATRATAEALPDLDDVLVKLLCIKDLNELLFMAGEGLIASQREKANAITAGCDVIDDLIGEVKDMLEAIQRGGEA